MMNDVIDGDGVGEREERNNQLKHEYVTEENQPLLVNELASPYRPVGYQRIILAILCTLSNIVCYADRTNIGIILPFWNFDVESNGDILSSFFYGYLCTQLIGGLASNKWGGKVVLIAGVIIWSIADVSTIFAKASFPALIAARVAMGLGEGVNFPALHCLSAHWFPAQERTRLVTFMTGGQDIGTIVAFLTTPLIISAWGWKYVFVVYGIASTLWVCFFTFLSSATPENHPRISSEEYAMIKAHRQANRNPGKIPWGMFLRNKSVYAIVIMHFCANWSWYVLLSWLPRYFKQHLRIDLQKNSLQTAAPYMFGLLGMLLAGFASDILITRYRLRTLWTRKIMNSLGSFIPALSLLLIRYASTNFQALALLSVTLFFARFSIAGYWTSIIDVGSTQYAGPIMALSNTIATVPGIIGSKITAYILSKSHSSWNTVFAIASIIYIVGGLVFLVFASDRRLQVPLK